MSDKAKPRAPFTTASGLSPVHMVTTMWRYRELIVRLAKREIAARVQGSVLGLLWLAIVPLAMLSVYTFAFTVVFKARWSVENNSSTHYAMLLFAGLLLFNVFSETINRAPGLLVENASYVKKVVFPLEILPVVTLLAALCNFVIGFLLLCVFYGFVFGVPPITSVLFPLVLVPLCLLTLGVGWLLASLGVFLRDIRHIVGILLTMLMFLSPIFYPVTAVPEQFRPLLYLNPLSIILEEGRGLLFFAQWPDWKMWAISMATSAIIAWLGFAWFSATRRGFADVL
jgi:lipopolysaccharide transport system permease protein